MKAILVPTDFSLAADNALNFAIPIAVKEKARIILVHAFKIDWLYRRASFPLNFIEQEIVHEKNRVNHHLRAKCEWIKTKSGVVCEYIGILGQPTDVINKVIKRKKPDLVVMGTKGASGLSGLILGSTAARIINNPICTIIVVPATAKYNGIQRIIYTTDFHQRNVFLVRKLKELNHLFQADISVVNLCSDVNVEGQKELLRNFRGKIEKQMDTNNITFRVVTCISIDDGLLKIARNKRYDLLVMTTHQRSFFGSLFNKSKTKKIANSIQIPLLVFKSK